MMNSSISSLYFLLIISTILVPCRQVEIRIDTTSLHRKTSDNFVGVAIDTVVFKREWDWQIFSDAAQSVKLQTLASALSPSFVRVGGTSSDFLIFDDDPPDLKFPRKVEYLSKDFLPSMTSANQRNLETLQFVPRSRMTRSTKKDDLFDWDVYYSDQLKKDLYNFTVTGQMFDVMYKFVEKMGWNMTFDLNVLLRNQDSWDPANPVKLIDYVAKGGYRLAGWELGNEPNSFYHLIKFRLEPEQLAQDYTRLKRILRGYKQFDNCIILGPSVTQLNKERTNDFFERFLSSGGRDVVTAATFHQYYLGSKSASQEDYTNPNVFNILIQEVATGVNLTRASGSKAQLWIGETSSAVGSLQEEASLTYRAGFMWLDKLGVSAYGGVDVVIRQSFYGGINAIIDRETLDPRPDYWLTLLYKQLVGSKVLKVLSPSNSGKLRAYAHCTATSRSGYSSGSVVVYVMNLYDEDQNLTFPDFDTQEPLHLFSMEPEQGRLDSRTVLLNGRQLEMINNSTLPNLLQPVRTQAPVILKAFRYSFIVFPNARVGACQG